MADILSQDEIDRLLGAAGASEPEADTSGLDQALVEEVEKLTRVFFASANSSLATLLARPASVSEGLGQTVDLAQLDIGRAVLFRFPFRSGFDGEMLFLLQHREAAMLADLILGGEGVAKDELEESDLDALKEAMTQVAGSGAPTLSATLGREVGFDPPDLLELAGGDELPNHVSWGDAYLALGTIQVDGVLETPLRILLSVAVAQEMAGLMSDEAEAEPAPQAPVFSQPAAEAPAAAAPVAAAPPAEPAPEIRNIDLILDIEVEVMVRLGEAEMPLKDIQRLRPGSIVDLDKDTDSPVELVVNDKVIARGELVVVSSDHFALRIAEIESPTERIRRLGS